MPRDWLKLSASEFTFKTLRRNLGMNSVKLVIVLVFAMVLTLPLAFTSTIEGQTATEALTTDLNRLTDDIFNGFGPKGTPLDEGEEPVPSRSFEDNKAIFQEVEQIADGLGPVFESNA